MKSLLLSTVIALTLACPMANAGTYCKHTCNSVKHDRAVHHKKSHVKRHTHCKKHYRDCCEKRRCCHYGCGWGW